MQGNETAYNHNADRMSEAIGINLQDFKKKVDSYNAESNGLKAPSEVVQSLEDYFTPRELAFMFWNETASSVSKVPFTETKQQDVVQ